MGFCPKGCTPTYDPIGQNLAKMKIGNPRLPFPVESVQKTDEKPH